MEKQPFFTVGIPIYNVEKYLSDAIESVLSQSFGDYEIVLVEDGSPDNCAQILDEYAAKDSRIRVIHRPNCGVSAARNTVLYSAKGEYIYFFDSDDTMCEGALENAYKAITEQNYPDFLQCGYIKILNGEIIECAEEYPGDKYFAPGVSKDDRLIMLWSEKKIKDQVYTRFLKRSFVSERGISFITSYTAQEDSELMFSLYRKADTIGYGNFFACNYNKYRENSISTVWSRRSVSNVFCRWHNFFYAEYPFYNLSENSLKIFHRERQEFLMKLRKGIMNLAISRNDEDVAFLTPMLCKFFEKEIRKLPLSGGSAPVNLCIKLLGITPTVKLLRFAAKIMKRGYYDKNL